MADCKRKDRYSLGHYKVSFRRQQGQAQSRDIYLWPWEYPNWHSGYFRCSSVRGFRHFQKVIDIFRKVLRICHWIPRSQLPITLALFVCWPVSTLLYYGLSLSANKIQMTNDVYLRYSLSLADGRFWLISYISLQLHPCMPDWNSCLHPHTFCHWYSWEKACPLCYSIYSW